ncbi:unnamed protein product, partial [Rangifer tarandus platyrhynchus]
ARRGKLSAHKYCCFGLPRDARSVSMVAAMICVRICRRGGSRARGTSLGGGTRGAGRLCAGSPGFPGYAISPSPGLRPSRGPASVFVSGSDPAGFPHSSLTPRGLPRPLSPHRSSDAPTHRPPAFTPSGWLPADRAGCSLVTTPGRSREAATVPRRGLAPWTTRGRALPRARTPRGVKFKCCQPRPPGRAPRMLRAPRLPSSTEDQATAEMGLELFQPTPAHQA